MAATEQLFVNHLDVLPPQTLSDHAEEFLRKEGKNLHPALDPSNHQTIPDKSLEEALPFKNDIVTLYTEDFRKAVDTYLDACEDATKTVLSRSWSAANWSDVLREVTAYNSKYFGETHSVRPRHEIRELGHEQKSTFVARSLPDEVFLNTLAGGIQLVLLLAEPILQTQRDILSEILRIPELLFLAGCLRSEDEPGYSLLSKTEHTYIAALVSIESTFPWTIKCSTGKKYEVALRGPLFSEPFEEKRVCLKDALDRLQDLVFARHEGSSTKVRGSGRYGNVHAHNSKIHMGDSYVINHNATQTEAGAHPSNGEGPSSQQQSNREMIEEMKRVLADTNSTARWLVEKSRDIRKLQRRISELEKASVALSIDDLLEILEINIKQPLYDLRKILRADPDLTDPRTALKISRDARFQSWQVLDLSAELFVETPAAFEFSRHISAVSLVSSNLIQTQESQPKASVIYFFCGLHTSSADQARGPSGMMRSLIMQAVQLYPPQLDFVSLRVKQQLEALNFKMLCYTLTQVIKRLPPTAVLFCILDSVSFFERQEWQNECEYAIETLRELVQDVSLDATLLFLVTSPVRMKRISSLFDPETVLSIESDDADTRGYMTERQLVASSQRNGRQSRVPIPGKHSRCQMKNDYIHDDSTDTD